MGSGSYHRALGALWAEGTCCCAEGTWGGWRCPTPLQAILRHQHWLEPCGARAARSQPLHLQKHSGSFRLGTREDFLSWKEDLSKQDLGLPSKSAKQGLSEGLLWWVQLYWLIAREGSARQLFCSGLHPLKLSFNYCCCHSDQVLLCLYLLIPLCVPALNLAFTFRSAVLHRDDSKEYEEKATTCHLVHLPAQWWLRFEWKIFFSPFPLPFKDLFDLYLFTSLSD